jgi:hypothetical protein
LGHPGEDAFVDVFGMGFATQVDLLLDETPLQKWDAGLVDGLLSGAWGALYLTSERLVWIRWRFAPPWVQKVLILNLRSVASAGVGRSLKLGLGLRQFVNVALKDGSVMRFWPPSYGERPERIASEIERFLRERGLLDG